MRLAACFFALAIFTTSFAFSGESWLAWDSPEAVGRIQTSQAKESFWKLARYYESQINLTYCGIASSVMALNALAVEAPPSMTLGKYRMFTQMDFFTPAVSAVLDKSRVEKEGISLEELSKTLRTFPIKVEKFIAKDLSHEKMRPIIISALKNPSQVVLVLYQRKVLGQAGEGHWSPLAAYDESSDSFLVMDVARFKYPPVWVDAATMLNAMQTSDSGDRPRGFLIIQK